MRSDRRRPRDGRPRRSSRSAHFLFASLLTLIVAAGAGRSMAAISTLTVDPPEPQCTDFIQVSVSGSFPDGCWRVEEILFTASSNERRTAASF